MVNSSSEDFDQWAFAIDRRRHVPHGKTDLLSDSSVRSDGCLDHVVVFGERHLHILLSYYPWRSIRRSHAPSIGPETFFASQFSAACTTNISGFDLRQAQGWRSNGRQLLVDPANEIASRDIPHEQEQTVSHLG